jgi:signal transduction histidine kinase
MPLPDPALDVSPVAQGAADRMLHDLPQGAVGRPAASAAALPEHDEAAPLLQRRAALADAVEQAQDVQAQARALEARLRDAAAAIPTVEEQAARIVVTLLETMGARAAVAVRLMGGADDGCLAFDGAAGLPAALQAMHTHLPVDEPTPLAEAVRRGQVVTCESAAELHARWPEFARPLDGLGIRALCATPVRHLGQVRGAVAVYFAHPRTFPSAERVQLRLLGARYARALHHSRLYLAEREARDAAERARREAEAARADAEEARREAEAANHAKDDFLAVVSHELRTPLQAVLGHAELLRDGVVGTPCPRQVQHLSRIVTAGQHLLAVVEDLLGFSRAQAGRAELSVAPFVLRTVLDQVGALASALAADKHLTYACRVHASVAMRVLESDERKLRQILVNLVGNAIKFTAKGGVALRVDEEGDLLVFRTQDTGIGIDPAHLEEIFEPFRQVSQGRARAATGTGLGLTISRQLARLLGGDLVAESTPGQGSTFTLTVPVRAPGR